MLLSIYGFGQFANEINVRMDPARLAAQVISGIGFLGAGAIMRTGATVSGLTTAASIWVVAAIGLCAGAGFYFGAGLITFVVLISLFVLNKWEKTLLKGRRKYELIVRIKGRSGELGDVTHRLDEEGIPILKLNVHAEKSDAAAEATLLLQYTLQSPDPAKLLQVIAQISLLPYVVSVEAPAYEFCSKSFASPAL